MKVSHNYLLQYLDVFVCKHVGESRIMKTSLFCAIISITAFLSVPLSYAEDEIIVTGKRTKQPGNTVVLTDLGIITVVNINQKGFNSQEQGDGGGEDQSEEQSCEAEKAAEKGRDKKANEGAGEIDRKSDNRKREYLITMVYNKDYGYKNLEPTAGNCHGVSSTRTPRPGSGWVIVGFIHNHTECQSRSKRNNPSLQDFAHAESFIASGQAFPNLSHYIYDSVSDKLYEYDHQDIRSTMEDGKRPKATQENLNDAQNVCG